MFFAICKSWREDVDLHSACLHELSRLNPKAVFSLYESTKLNTLKVSLQNLIREQIVLKTLCTLDKTSISL